MKTDKEILARAIWLAFDASIPVGMGALHVVTAAQVTEDTILDNCAFQERDGGITAYTDYVCGRMMKTQFAVKDGALTLGKSEPRYDYQSWSHKYSTNQALIDAVTASFETQPTS